MIVLMLMHLKWCIILIAGQCDLTCDGNPRIMEDKMITGTCMDYQIHLRPVMVRDLEYWYAIVIHNSAIKGEWQGHPRLSPEGAAYLAKRYIQGKPDLKK